MPLRKGGSRATISGNISEIVHDWEKDGSIGDSHPSDKQAAVRQAVAISLETARETALGKTRPVPKPGGPATGKGTTWGKAAPGRGKAGGGEG